METLEAAGPFGIPVPPPLPPERPADGIRRLPQTDGGRDTGDTGILPGPEIRDNGQGKPKPEIGTPERPPWEFPW